MTRELARTALIAALVAVTSRPAKAAGGRPGQGEARDLPCEPGPGDRRHDGFFARSQPGVALLSAHVVDSGVPPQRSGVHGIGQSGSLFVGGTPAPGFVVGGMVWTARIDPTFVEGGVTVVPDDDSVKVTMLRTGPFVDFYPNPTRGFHLLGSLALGLSVESDVKGRALEPFALGVSPSLGLGYEWFVGSEFSLGAVGQTTLGYLERRAPDGSQRTLFFAPELALSATFH